MSRVLKPSLSKQQVVSEFRRTEIITAAREVFAERGYLATVDEIAACAGLAKGTIYVYFDSKEQIYNAVLENDLESLRRLTLERIGAAATPLAKVAAYINARFEYCEIRRDFFRIMLIEQSNSPLLSKAKAREWLQEPINQLTRAIETGIKSGEIRDWPAETLAWTVADLTTGALQRRLLSTPTGSARHDADFLIEFIFAALRRPPRMDEG